MSRARVWEDNDPGCRKRALADWLIDVRSEAALELELFSVWTGVRSEGRDSL
jgi:hypothetical protein